jgi:putative membrane protein
MPTLRTLRSAPLAGALLLAVAVAACKKDDNAGAAAAGDTASAVPAADSAPAAAPVTDTAQAAQAAAVTDPQIAAIVVAANNVDIDAGKLAQGKAASPRVKEFAQTMIRDHTAVNKAATDLVTRLKVTPEENPTSRSLTDGGASNVQALQGQSGAAFDKAYMDHEVAYHQQVLDAIDHTLVPGAQNVDLKKLLQDTRPAVAHHLDMARQIQGSLESR